MTGLEFVVVDAHVVQLQAKWRLTHHTAVHAFRFLANHAGWVITSGRRSARYNRRVGGVAESLHLVGMAIDVTDKVGRSPREEFEALAFLQNDKCEPWCPGAMELIDEGDHFHAAWWV